MTVFCSGGFRGGDRAFRPRSGPSDRGDGDGGVPAARHLASIRLWRADRAVMGGIRLTLLTTSRRTPPKRPASDGADTRPNQARKRRAVGNADRTGPSRGDREGRARHPARPPGHRPLAGREPTGFRRGFGFGTTVRRSAREATARTGASNRTLTIRMDDPSNVRRLSRATRTPLHGRRGQANGIAKGGMPASWRAIRLLPPSFHGASVITASPFLRNRRARAG